MQIPAVLCCELTLHFFKKQTIRILDQNSRFEYKRMWNIYLSLFREKNCTVTEFPLNFCTIQIQVQGRRSKSFKTKYAIVEFGTKDFDEGIVVCEGQAELRPNIITSIHLNKLILIKAGVRYKIEMKQSTSKNYRIRSILKDKVKIEPDLCVEFHADMDEWTDCLDKDLVNKLIFIHWNVLLKGTIQKEFFLVN